MCSHTKSFQSVYQWYRKLHCVPSYHRRFDSGRLFALVPRHKPNRRNANKSEREFIQCIDVGTDVLSQELYSCKKCEVEMCKCDYEQLSLDSVRNPNLRRLYSIVIDAKVAPLLKEGEPSTDEHDVLHATSSLAM